MKNAISYKVIPSSNERDRLEVEIAWNDQRGQFRVDIKKGLAPNKRRWFAESPELDSILQDSAGLQLSAGVHGTFGFDGTAYSLQIGFIPSVTFSWWMEVPEEWAPLKLIVDRIHGLLSKIEKDANT